MKEIYLVSACLLGEKCKYNASDNKNENIISFLKDKTYYPICPEVMGGLSIPRIPCEIKNGKVVDREGNDKTREFKQGAQKTLELAQQIHATHAILQSRSPSCGVGTIYDGTFSGKLIEGNGISAQLLQNYGIIVLDSGKFCENNNAIDTKLKKK